MELPFVIMIGAVLVAAVVITGAIKMKLNHRKALKAVKRNAELQVAEEVALAKAREKAGVETPITPTSVVKDAVSEVKDAVSPV